MAKTKAATAKKSRKPMGMPDPWKQEMLTRMSRVEDWVRSGRMANGIPADYLLDNKTWTFVPPQKEVNDG